MIRKYFHDIKIAGSLAVLLALTACAGDEFDSAKNNANTQYDLTVVTDEQMMTRTPGDDNLNENRFVSIDYYFFATNHDEDILLLHKTEGVRNETNNTTLDNSTHTYNGPLSENDLITLFGADYEVGDKCYVYVLTNLLPSTRTAIEEAKATWGDEFSLGILKRISFQDTHISDNGKQECFVMFGGGEVSLSQDEDTNVKTISGDPIRVTRDAAKVVLTVTNVQEELEVMADDGETVVSKWRSVPEQMHVMFYNGKNKSNVHSQINAGLHYVPEANDNCFFDLTARNGGWRNLVAANSSQPYKNLTHTYPFYTYLSDWTEASGADPESYMILVVPWQQIDVETGANIGAPRTTYYQVETTTTDTYYENYYYPLFLNVGILGSFELPEPVDIEGTYMIVPWGEKDVNATMREPRYLIVEENEYTVNNVNSASVPYISSHEITEAYVTKVKWLTLQTFAGDSITNSTDTDGSLTVNTYVRNERFDVTTDNNLLTLDHTISADQYTRYDVTVKIVNAAGLEEEVVFTIYPAIFVSNEPGGNTFVNGRFAHVQNAVGGPWYGNGGYNWYTNDRTFPNSGWISTGYGSLRFDLGSNNVTNQSLTRITVSSFNEDDSHYVIRKNNTNTTYTYKLSDPRVEDASLNSNLANYIVTARSSRTTYDQAANQDSWRGLATIKRGSDASDLIAPDFIICSGWGRTQGQNAQSFQTFERRCATYQEAGYPAGRWRIPTEAELAYIFKLQQLQVIANLFQVTNGNAYWASSGWAVNGYNNGTITFTNTPSVNGNNTAGVRCVYDIWYWGEEKMSANEYHANPTK